MISVFSIWGYIDLRLDLQRFDRASNGKRKENTNLDQDIDVSQVASLYEIDFISSKYEDLNCFEASKNLVLSKTIHDSSIGSIGTGMNNEIESEAVRCHLAKNMIFAINDKLMLLVVLAACSINMIFQSMLAVCNGKLIDIDILFVAHIFISAFCALKTYDNILIILEIRLRKTISCLCYQFEFFVVKNSFGCFDWRTEKSFDGAVVPCHFCILHACGFFHPG